MKIQIKNRKGEVIIEGEYASLRDAVEQNCKRLDGARLNGARLNGARLDGAILVGASLDGASLVGASLDGASLDGASLDRASLVGARLDGASLDGASLVGAILDRASLVGARLDGASLDGAILDRAILVGAILVGASLDGASLVGARLDGASLDGAKDVEPAFLPQLYILKLQHPKTKLRAWKYLNGGKSPYQGMEYIVGKRYIFDNSDSDERRLCAEGGNVATLGWCLRDDLKSDEFIEVEFAVEDIIAVPFGTDGKFRVCQLEVLRKVNRKEAIEILRKAMGVGK